MTRARTTHQNTLTAGRWAVDPRYSTVSVIACYLGALQIRVCFPGIGGEIVVEPGTGTTSVAVLIDATTATTPISHYDGRLHSADLLDTGRHPWIGFRSTAVIPGPQVVGNLTVKNTVSPTVLQVEPTGTTRDPLTGARYAGFRATAELDRFAVGLGRDPERPGRLGNTLQVRTDIVVVLDEPAAAIDTAA